MPLFNLTTKSTVPPSLHSSQNSGSVGVACTGLLIADISDRLRSSFPTDFSEKGVYIFEDGPSV